MKKIIIILYSFLFCLQAIFGQTGSITWGRELPRARKTDISVLIGADKNSFYCLRSRRTLFKVRPATLEKYSRGTLNIEYLKEVKMPEIEGKELNFEKIVLLNGTLLMFTSRYDGGQDKNIAYVQKINASDLSYLDKPKEIDYITAFRKRNKGSFDFVLSNDSSKILIMHNEHYDRYSNEKFSYKLLDSQAKELWAVSLELPYKDKYFTIDNYVVSNDGTVYMMAKIKKEREERERKKPSYRYDLLSYNYNKKIWEETEIKAGDKFISDAGFGITPKGTITVGGFYSNKTENGTAGIFFQTLDKDNRAVIATGAKDFTEDFLSEFMSERRAKKHKELYDYKVDHLVLKSDGSFDMVAEQYYVQVVTVCNTRGGCTTTYHYYYNDIIVAGIANDASIKWIKRIPKMHHSVNDFGYYSSYSFFNFNNKLHFIYNDNPKNLTKPKKYSRNGICRKMVTLMAVMDENGNLERSTLFSCKEEKIYTRPKISIRMSNNQTLFYAIKRKKFKFGIITY